MVLKEKLKKLSIKCYIDLDPNLQLLIGINNLNPTSLKQLEKLLDIRELKQAEKSRIISIYERKRRETLVPAIKNISKIMKLFHMKNDREDLRIKAYKLFNSNDKKQVFLSLISESLIAIHMKDDQWLEKTIVKLIKLPTQIIIAELSSDINSISNLLPLLPPIFKKIKLTIKDKQIYKFLILHLSPLIKSNHKLKVVAQNEQAHFSLSEIITLSKNKYYSTLFPLLWYDEIKKRSSKQEAQEYILRISKDMKWDLLTNEDFFLLKYTFPKKKKYRKMIAKKLLKLTHSELVSHQFLLGTLLKNKIIKKELALVDESFARPSFLLLRRLFLKALRESYYIDFNLFQLFKLGNYSKDLLLWKLL